MDILEIIKGRRSIRAYSNKSIPKNIIEELKESLIWAPSAGNVQARKFYFISDQDIKNRLVNAALEQAFISEAPLVIVACADLTIEKYYGKRGSELYALQDIAASIQNLMLLCYERGLGSVWIGAFNEGEVTKILNLPSNLRPVSLIPVGYPLKSPNPPKRVRKDSAIIEI
ncbi:MAG: nitroreductase family protein [Candidatus Omnitrophota bacterium]